MHYSFLMTFICAVFFRPYWDGSYLIWKCLSAIDEYTVSFKYNFGLIYIFVYKFIPRPEPGWIELVGAAFTTTLFFLWKVSQPITQRPNSRTRCFNLRITFPRELLSLRLTRDLSKFVVLVRLCMLLLAHLRLLLADLEEKTPLSCYHVDALRRRNWLPLLRNLNRAHRIGGEVEVGMEKLILHWKYMFKSHFLRAHACSWNVFLFREGFLNIANNANLPNKR